MKIPAIFFTSLLPWISYGWIGNDQTYDSPRGVMSTETKYNADTIRYVIRSIAKTSKIDCASDNSSCSNIVIEYPDFQGLRTEVKARFEEHVVKSFINVVPGADNCSTLSQLATSYITHNELDRYQYDGPRAWFKAQITPEYVSSSLISVNVKSDYWAYGHFDNRMETIIHISPATGERLEQVLQVKKYCESIYEQVDRGEPAPDPVRTFNFIYTKLKPVTSSDTLTVFKDNLKGMKIEAILRAGKIKVTQPTSYYIGHDTDSLPEVMFGMKDFKIKINHKTVDIPVDHILRPYLEHILLLADQFADRLYIHMYSSEGGGSSRSFWIVENGRLTGDYRWEFGYDEWSPRVKNLDAFQLNGKDKCQLYKITFGEF